MTTTALPITQILKGHTQSLFQALRLLSNHPNSYSTASENTVTAEALLAEIQNLSAVSNTADEPSADTLPDDKLILRGYLQAQSPPLQLARDTQPALLFVDLLISELLSQTKPHVSITHLSRKLSLQISCRLLTRPDIAITANHPFCRLIQNLYRQLAIWEPAAGKKGKAFADWLVALSHDLASLDINSTQLVDCYSSQLENIIDEDHQRSRKVEQRLLETASGTDVLESVRNTVLEFIGRRLSHRPLPEDVIAFIQSTLISDLQYILIHEGVDCELWKKWKRLLQIFSWAFQTSDSESHQTKVATLLSPLIEKLDDSYWRGLPKADQYPDFAASLQHYFLQALTSTPIATVPFPDILASSPDATSPIVLSQSIEQDISHINEGDWFFFRQEIQNIQKGKLVRKHPQQNSLLITKYSGQKLAEYTFDEFSVGLTSKSILPLNTRQLYAQALRTTLQRLDKHHQKHLQAEQHRAISEEKQKAALKAQKEAKDLTQKADKLPEVSDNLRQALQEQISQLNVGAWMRWQQSSTESVEIKLSVKLQNSDKFIFTDRLGQRIADYSSAQLIELIAKKQIIILSQGDKFENSLEKVVRGLRKPLS
ncbi:DUF1631 family protein [Pseudomaricurvus sp.]|uniref:DUF1631 family protein n=1 Tax=Pseudomaricurvus sp. TaxID=2004510 RepID=UPI003F6AB629